MFFGPAPWCSLPPHKEQRSAPMNMPPSLRILLLSFEHLGTVIEPSYATRR
jgi:hypothetical protein